LSDLRSNSRDQQETFTEMNNQERELHSLLTSPAVGEPDNGQGRLNLENKRLRKSVQHPGMASNKTVESVMKELAPNSTDKQLGFNEEEESEEEFYSPGDTINSREEFVGSNSKSKAQDLQEERTKIVFDSIRNHQEESHRKHRIARGKVTLKKQQQNHFKLEVREKRLHERFNSRLLEKIQEEMLARKEIEKEKITSRGIIKEKCASKRNSSSQNKLVNSRQRPENVLLKEPGRHMLDKIISRGIIKEKCASKKNSSSQNKLVNSGQRSEYVLSKQPGRHMHDKNTKAVKHLICRSPTHIRKSVVGEKELGIINKIAVEREIAEKETMRAQIAATAQAAALALSKIQEEHRQRLERLKPLPTLNW